MEYNMNRDTRRTAYDIVDYVYMNLVMDGVYRSEGFCLCEQLFFPVIMPHGFT